MMFCASFASPALAGVAGVGQRDAQRALVVLGYALIGGARFRRAAGDIGNQRAMIAQEVRRPVRQLLPVQQLERFVGFVLRLIDPGARQRARQFADRVAARLVEVIFGFLVAARLEGREPQECARGAVGGLRRDQLARQRLHAGPVAFAGFHLERVFDQHFIVGVLLQRFAVVGCRRRRVVLGARQPAGEIAAEQRAGLGARLGAIPDACCRRCGICQGTETEKRCDPEERRGASAHVTSCRERYERPRFFPKADASREGRCLRPHQCRKLSQPYGSDCLMDRQRNGAIAANARRPAN